MLTNILCVFIATWLNNSKPDVDGVHARAYVCAGVNVGKKYVRACICRK